jgi:ABC-2 type transport system permease protein
MTQQILAIVWAQFRITRNHFLRTGFGGVLMWILTALWYCVFLLLGVVVIATIPQLHIDVLRRALPISLLALFLYSQTVPLLTLSTGWSLQLDKLQVYPIRDSALFGLEVLLRVTSAPESIFVLLAGVIGLARHPGISLFVALCLLLFIPFNLFLQLAVRDFVVHAFERNRFREIVTIFFVSLGVLPQIVLRTGLGLKLKPYFLAFANGLGTPWQATAALSLGQFSVFNFASLACWTVLVFWFARRQFACGLLKDDAFRGATSDGSSKKTASLPLLDSIGNLFQDPTAALIQKEFRSLLRMPRFRVMLGMACVFSTLIFLPMLLGEGAKDAGSNFFRHNYFSVVNIYALFIMADVLLLNIFGVDRAAAQLYFVSPVPLAKVIKAKNLAAWAFIFLQNLLVVVLTPFFVHVTFASIAAGILASAVASIHLTWAGNLLSVMMPRPIDPRSTLKKQANAKVQLWILLCTLGMAVLVGFAYLARWAFDSDWALLGVLLFEFAIGYVVYLVSLDSAVEHGLNERERIIDALSKTSSPVGGTLGLS